MKREFLIIGQGLAGSLLAWRLHQRNHTFHIVDNNNNNASKVAAGLINPVTGKRFVKEANFEHLLHVAKALYHDIEASTQASLFVERPMLRVLKSQNEIDTANKRLHQQEYSDLLQGNIKTIEALSRITSLIEQKQTGFIDTQKILRELKQIFSNAQSYINAEFDYRELIIKKQSITWRGSEYEHVIFCDGAKVRHNPFFKELPWQPVKGETLTLNISDAACVNVLQEFILNYGYWLVQIAPMEFRTGATFTRDELTDQATESARNHLLQALHEYIGDVGIEVIKQNAAIRLATPDRQPVIGAHTEYNNMYIFNGFGSKGTIKIPYYSLALVNHIVRKQALPEEVNTERFNAS